MRAMMIAVGGTRDLYAIHNDREFAKASGARDIFVNTMFYEALFGRIAKAAACAATGIADRETREHLLGFANRCLELQRAEVKVEDEAFGDKTTKPCLMCAAPVPIARVLSLCDSCITHKRETR